MKTPADILFRRKRNGFTLTELLVVILIIVVLAVLTFSFVNRGKVAAAKSATMSQMRNIHLGVVSWMADKNWSDFPEVSTSIGDFPNESGVSHPKAFGNPAKALYNKDEPSAGYIQDPAYFFSPLLKNKVPSQATYNPASANSGNIWGTYAWFHPWKIRPSITRIDPAKENQLLMSIWYDPTDGKRFDKNYFLVLMREGSVESAGESVSGSEPFDKFSGLKAR